MYGVDVRPAIPSLIAKHINLFICPVCRGDLLLNSDHLQCSSCSHEYRSEEGIPLLFWPHEWKEAKTDVTEVMKTFYEETPFPNYEELDSSNRLREKAQKGLFVRLLDEQIHHSARILEIGCGTGQLTNFLGMTWGRTVFGTDICLNSLRLGQGFKARNAIEHCAFLQMNLFQPVFKPESFDVVVCNGVLHHTSNPLRGFQSIAALVKKGGFIIVGLYNRYGRVSTYARRVMFRLSGDRLKFLDSRLRDKNLSEIRKHTWLMDQYYNPHESTHTVGEVLRWFDQSGFTFVHSIPKPEAFDSFSPHEKLFETLPKGNKLDHFLVQLGMLCSGGTEGGFFIMIGSKQS